MQDVVFSTITPDQIDLSRTRSDGVEGLKGFLEFAAKGRSALAVRGGASAAKNGFGEVVAAELEKLGYKCRCSVGCSDYKIDVAVCNPDEPDKYILGINCGSLSSYENGTASDRTLSQPSVLRGLGWNVMSVYILDWIDNRERVLSKIKDELDKAVAAYRDPKLKEAEVPKPKQELVFEQEQPIQLSDQCDRYDSFTVKSYGVSENFNEANKAKITKNVSDVLKAEAPVSRSVLAKKVFACWGITRPGAAMKKTLDAAIENVQHGTTLAGDSEFLWLPEQIPAEYNKCRTVYADDERRDIADVPPQETAAGIKRLMERQIAMQREDLLRETAHLFGYTRMTPAVETAMSLGIREAKSRGFIAFGEDGKVTYIEKQQ